MLLILSCVYVGVCATQERKDLSSYLDPEVSTVTTITLPQRLFEDSAVALTVPHVKVPIQLRRLSLLLQTRA